MNVRLLEAVQDCGGACTDKVGVWSRVRCGLADLRTRLHRPRWMFVVAATCYAAAIVYHGVVFWPWALREPWFPGTLITAHVGGVLGGSLGYICMCGIAWLEYMEAQSTRQRRAAEFLVLLLGLPMAPTLGTVCWLILGGAALYFLVVWLYRCMGVVRDTVKAFLNDVFPKKVNKERVG